MDKEIFRQFQEILEERKIRTVFQPIVSLRDAAVYGYEALSRGPADTIFENPEKLFDYAEKFDKVCELDHLCRKIAIKTIYLLSIMDAIVFLNVSPKIINDEKFNLGITKNYLNKYGMSPHNITFEITERDAIENISDFKKTVEHYKSQHYKIAIDDAGAGYSGLNLISDIHPHFIKLDMNLIRDIDKDSTKQALIKSFVDFALITNTYLIAEGIETKEELLKLIEIGVNYGQGFYLQKPDTIPVPLKEDVRFAIIEANAKKNHLLDKSASELFISNISKARETLNPKILVGQVYELMKNNTSVLGLCVTENEKVVGTVTRAQMYRCLSGQYGFTLYSKKTIDKVMSTDFLEVNYNETIELVSKKAMSRSPEKLYDFITVTRNGNYYGIVTVKELLEHTIQIEVNNAKHVNPLSELPGNIIIEKKIEKCINNRLKCYVLYFDMDNFKAYNDVYGFENGDRMIKEFTSILKKIIVSEKDFIGHIGGDDFMAIVSKDPENICRTIIAEFDQKILGFYNTNDVKKGFITTKNRHGIEEDFPFTSLSISGVDINQYETVYQLSTDVARLKKMCKMLPGSNFIIE